MKTSKVTLLAASFVLAMAFTVSCSGDDGSDGEQGIAGSSCLAEDKGTHVEIKCETQTTSIEMAKVEWCEFGTIPYNPAKYFCDDYNKVRFLCNRQSYSSSEYCSQGTIKTYDSVSGSSRTYKTVEIGTQVWMAENLEEEIDGSVCYDNLCGYGRLYDWATAMNLSSDCNSISCASQINSPHQGICPDGWHIPSNEDWIKLVPDYHSGIASNLRAQNGWYDYDSYGILKEYRISEHSDIYGFSALPGGFGYQNNEGTYSFKDRGMRGSWWSSSEDEDDINYFGERYAMYLNIYFTPYYNESSKTSLYSVRCVKD